MTTNPADFVDAHGRHWEDAEALLGLHRRANADQLYGFSAECGLEAVMEALGMNVDATTGIPSDKAHRTHVQHLWSAFRTFTSSRKGAIYLSMLPNGSPFADWSHHDRYAHRSYCCERDVRSHRAAARQIRPMVQHLQQSKGQ